MDFVHQGFKIGHGSEFGIGLHEIRDAVITAQTAFPSFFTDRENGHEPKYIHSHFCQTIHMLAKGGKGAFRRILPDVYLIHDCLVIPIGIAMFDHLCRWFNHGF
jgi:hypothetical protein